MHRFSSVSKVHFVFHCLEKTLSRSACCRIADYLVKLNVGHEAKQKYMKTAKEHDKKPCQPTLSERSESGTTNHPEYQEVPHSSVSGVKEANASILCLQVAPGKTHLLRETMIDLIGKLVHLSLLTVGLATRTRDLDAVALQDGSFWL